MGDVVVDNGHGCQKPKKPPVPVGVEGAADAEEEHLAPKARLHGGQEHQEYTEEDREFS